jgi:hypothetical protein
MPLKSTKTVVMTVLKTVTNGGKNGQEFGANHPNQLLNAAMVPVRHLPRDARDYYPSTMESSHGLVKERLEQW